MSDEKAVEHASNALQEVMDACSGERLLVICDDVRSDVGECFAQAGLEIGLYTRLVTLKTEPSLFRRELPRFVKEAIVLGDPHLVVNCLRGPAEETPFRIKLIHLEVKDKNRRLGHGPGITLDMLTEGALALSLDEHKKMNSLANRLMAATDGAKTVQMSTPGGTDVKMSIEGRGFFTDTKITNKKWGNLPTGEVIVGPVENSLEGLLVCDVAIGGVGPIGTPVRIRCRNGKAVRIEGGDPEVIDKVKNSLSTDEMASVVGEMAVGLNPKARIVREFLETEKVLGTAHIAFGNNIDYPTGGKNNSANHMDFMVDKPTVTVVFPDGRKQKIVQDGTIIV